MKMKRAAAITLATLVAGCTLPSGSDQLSSTSPTLQCADVPAQINGDAIQHYSNGTCRTFQMGQTSNMLLVYKPHNRDKGVLTVVEGYQGNLTFERYPVQDLREGPSPWDVNYMMTDSSELPISSEEMETLRELYFDFERQAGMMRVS